MVVDQQGNEVVGEQGLLTLRRPWPAMLRTLYKDERRFVETYFQKLGRDVYLVGDAARQDEDGYFWVIGRVDDVINVSGHRLSTAEVESAIVAHPKVAESAVVAQAAASLGKASAPLVCTDGMPAASQRRLLAQLHNAGACLHYHGDFDWPGIRIGNFVMQEFNAQPWRFGRQDYNAAPVSELSLSDQPAIPSWDSGLAASMRQRGTAVHEEAVLETLLDDLSPRRETV
jgi:acyl-CoA synthetase (AMP-forming)/AMP-acid ligase II